MQAYSKPVLGLSTIQSATFIELFQDFGEELVQVGYNCLVARLHLRSVAPFGVVSHAIPQGHSQLLPDRARQLFPDYLA